MLVITVKPVAAKNFYASHKLSTLAKDLIVQNAIAEITGVQLNPTAEGLQVILETATGQRLTPLIFPEGQMMA